MLDWVRDMEGTHRYEAWDGSGVCFQLMMASFFRCSVSHQDGQDLRIVLSSTALPDIWFYQHSLTAKSRKTCHAVPKLVQLLEGVCAKSHHGMLSATAETQYEDSQKALLIFRWWLSAAIGQSES